MSEAYTEPYNATIEIKANTWVAQTFTPRLTHDAYYFEAHFKVSGPFGVLTTQLRNTVGGKPGAVVLAEKTTRFGDIFYPSLMGLRQFSFHSDAHLSQGVEYAIVHFYQAPHIADYVTLRYQQGGTHYATGAMCTSTNAGASWTIHPADTLVFAEWGSPFSLKPPPYYPPDKFAGIDIHFTPYTNGVYIVLRTSKPCHLFMYWQGRKPLTMRRARIIRGLVTMWHGKFYLDKSHPVEQTELGDTLFHTFHLSPWRYCWTRWFVFAGSIGQVTSTSGTAIFYYHHPGAPAMTHILRPEGGGDICEIPYEVGAPCPNHWQNVDEVIPDETATRVFMSLPYNNVWKYDLYALSPPPTWLTDIASVAITIRVWGLSGQPYSPCAVSLIKTNGAWVYGNYVYDTSLLWKDHTTTWTKNPVTGLPWTWDELNNLQAGVGLYMYMGVGWYSRGDCTQVYVTATRQIQDQL